MIKQLLCSTMTALLLALVLGVSGYARQGAKLKVDKPDFDFGTVYRGNEARHTFVITNTGMDTLKITDVRSNCGCTIPSIAKRNLAPGESTELTAVFDSGNFAGSVTKNILVDSNDPTSPITKLSIHSDVQQVIEVYPASVYFARPKQGESLQRELEIKNLSGKTVNIKKIASTVSTLETQLDKTVLQPDESTVLHLQIPKVENGMKLTGELTIFNSSQEGKVKILVYGDPIR